MSVTIDLTGQTALITGGAAGLGREIALTLGRAGAKVAINDIDQPRIHQTLAELRSHGIDCAGFAGDVRDSAAMAAMADGCVAAFGGIDIFIANAGLYPVDSFLEMSEEAWDRVLDINLKGAFLSGQAVARRMISGGRGGRMVLMSSGAANAAFWGWSHYCVSKAGVAMLARAMALELGEHGIRVNAVLPGYIGVPEGGAHLSESYKERARTTNLLGRPGTPADIANAVLMLCSDLADFIDGATLSVDGGSGAGRIGLKPID